MTHIPWNKTYSKILPFVNLCKFSNTISSLTNSERPFQLYLFKRKTIVPFLIIISNRLSLKSGKGGRKVTNFDKFCKNQKFNVFILEWDFGSKYETTAPFFQITSFQSIPFQSMMKILHYISNTILYLNTMRASQ